MPTSSQQTNISDAITSIRSAENILTQQIRVEEDTLTAIKLTNEFTNLESILSQLLHAQNSADDASFAAATASLKTGADVLQADEAIIKKIIGDVATAAKLIGYITQALTFIAKL